MLIEVSLDPILVRAGALAIGWHGLFTALAIVVAVRLGTALAQRAHVPGERLTGVVGWGLVGGVVGARLFHVLDHLPMYLQDPLAILAVWEGGIAVYGAFIGGLAAGVLAARRERLPAWRLLDAAAPALLLGQAIGRLGCFINGDAWGAPTGGAWGVVYRHPEALLPSSLPGVPTHPYPLYEALAALFVLVVVAYAGMRFGLSLVRQEARILLGLQEAQVVALATGLPATAALLVGRRDRTASGPAYATGGP